MPITPRSNVIAGAEYRVHQIAGAPVNGTSGTLAGTAIIGALLIDITGALLYQNVGTKASPTWQART
jgi:hypothetical protein